MNDIAHLNMAVDSTDTDKAAKSLDNLADFAEKAEKATGALGQAVQKNAKEYKSLSDMADDLAKSERKAVEQIHQRAKAYTKSAGAEVAAMRATEKSAQSMSQYAAETEKLRAGLTKLLTAIDPLEARLNKLDDAEEKLTQTFRRGIIDAEKYAESLAKIGAQRNDIAEKQLKEIGDGAEYAAGMMEKLGLGTRLAQQDLMDLGRAAAQGDLKQVQNSIFQLTRNTGALSLALSAAGAAAGVAVGSIALLGTAYYQGYQRTQEFNRSIALTGNALGVSAAEMAHMTTEVGRLSGSYAQAERAANLIVRSGRIASDSIQDVMKTAVEMQQAFGQSVDETISEFERLGESPSQTLIELDEKYRFLTAAVLEQVLALESQGRMEEAIKLAQAEASRALGERTKEVVENVGVMEKAWQGLKGVVAGTWETMLNVGRAQPVVAELAKVNEAIALLEEGEESLNKLKSGLAGGYVASVSGAGMAQVTGGANSEALYQRRAELEETLKLQEERAKAAARDREIDDQEKERLKLRNSYLETYTKSTLASELAKANEELKQVTAGLDKESTEYAKVMEAHYNRVEQINKKYETKGGGRGAGANNQWAAEAARLRARIAEETSLAKALENTVAKVSRLNEFERKAMQLREQASKETKVVAKHRLEELAALNEQAGALVRNNKLTEEAAKERLKYLDGIEKSTKSTYDEAQKLRDQAQTMGMSRMALEALTTARIEEQIAQLQTQEGSEEEIKLLREQIAARHELTDAIGQQEMARASYEAQQELERDWQKTVDNIDDVFRRGFADMLNEGKGSWSSFTKSLATTFKTTVADQIYKMFAQPFVAKVVVGMAGGLGMGGAANAMGGGSFAQVANEMGGGASQFGMVGGMSWLTNFGGNVSNTLADFGANLAMNSDMFSGVGESLLKNAESIGQFADLAGDILGYGSAIFNITKGNWGAGLGGAAGTAFGGPIGGAIGSTLGSMVDKMFGSGETRVGGHFHRQQGGQAQFIGGPSGGYGGTQTVSAMDEVLRGATDTIDSLFEALDVIARVDYFGASFEGSDKGRGGTQSNAGLYVGGEYITVGSVGKGSGYGGTSGTPEEMFENMVGDMQLTILEAWQTAADQMPDMIGDMLSGLDVRSLNPEQAGQIISEIDAIVGAVTTLSAALDQMPIVNLTGLAFDATASLVSLMGGLEGATTQIGAYYENFYTEAEKAQHTTDMLTQEFGRLNIAIPDSREAFRDLANSLDLTTEDGRVLYAELMGLSGAFASVTDEIGALEPALESAAEDLGELTRLLSVLPFNHLIEMSEGAALALAELAGGVGAFTSDLSGYYQNFFTEQERFIAGAGQLVRSVGEIGFSLPATRDGFRDMMDSIDMTTQSGKESFASLLGTAGQANDYYRYVEQTTQAALNEVSKTVEAARQQELNDLRSAQSSRTQAVRSQQSAELSALRDSQNERTKALKDGHQLAIQAVRDSYSEQVEAARDAISSIGEKLRELGSLSDLIERGLDSLRGFSDLATALHRDASRDIVAQATKMAQAGKSLAGFDGLADAVDALSRLETSDFTSLFDYEMERAESANALRELGDLTGGQIGVQELQLTAMEAQLEQLDGWRDAQIETLNEIAERELAQQLSLFEQEQSAVAALAERQAGQATAFFEQEQAAINAHFDALLSQEQELVKAQIEEMLLMQAEQASLTDIVDGASLRQFAQLVSIESAIYASSERVAGSVSSAVGQAVSAANAAASAAADAAAMAVPSIPAFADGGRYGGGLALVGERGPELINFSQPGMVYTAAQSRSLMSGGDNKELVQLMRQLIGSIGEMRSETRALVVSVSKILGIVDDVTEGGSGGSSGSVLVF